jgi:nitrogen fixation NifU-like protein
MASEMNSMIDPESGTHIDQSQIGEGELTEEQLIYKENILDHYKHPHNKRIMADCDVHCKDLNPLCGDTIEVYLKIADGRIADAAFQGAGCAISQASVSMLTDKLKGMAVADARALTRDDVLRMLNIPIGAVRMKCAMLGLRTAQSALASFEEMPGQPISEKNIAGENDG